MLLFIGIDNNNKWNTTNCNNATKHSKKPFCSCSKCNDRYQSQHLLNIDAEHLFQDYNHIIDIIY